MKFIFIAFLIMLTFICSAQNVDENKFMLKITGFTQDSELEKAGAKVVAINANPSGKNINVMAGSEYVRGFPKKFGALINHFEADFGLAFDGDADRVVFVDTKSNLIDGDHILGLLADYLDRDSRLLGKSVVTTHMRNAGLKRFIENHGLRLYETPVGDKNVVAKILELRQEFREEQKYGLGGEQSGHVVLINNQYVTGDGIRTALFLMKAFLQSSLNEFDEFAAVLQKTPQIIGEWCVVHRRYRISIY